MSFSDSSTKNISVVCSYLALRFTQHQINYHCHCVASKLEINAYLCCLRYVFLHVSCDNQETNRRSKTGRREDKKKITSLRLRAPQHPGVQMLQMIKVRQVIWLKDELPTHGDSKAAHCSRCLQIWCPAQRLALVLASIFHAICSFFRWPFGRRASASFCCVFASHWIESCHMNQLSTHYQW